MLAAPSEGSAVPSSASAAERRRTFDGAESVWRALDEDLASHGYAATTRRLYRRCAANLAAHLDRSPEEIGPADVRRYLTYLVETKRVRLATVKLCTAALKFLFEVTLRRPGAVRSIHYTKVPRRPQMLSEHEVERLLSARPLTIPFLVGRLAYHCGLRISEACALGVGDVDLAAGVIHVRARRGARTRTVSLDTWLRRRLQEHLAGLPEGAEVVFPTGAGRRSVAPRAVRRALRRAAVAAGITRRIYPDLLRHAQALRRLEVDGRHGGSEVLLGHGTLDASW